MRPPMVPSPMNPTSLSSAIAILPVRSVPHRLALRLRLRKSAGRVHVLTDAKPDIASLPPYGNGTLPPDIRSRSIAGVNGMSVHILEAGHETRGRPAVLLLHGFPELAYSWRKVLPALAAAGYHAIAPDQRGYGRTTGWDGRYDGDLASYRFLNLVRDAIGVVRALGRDSVDAVVGHDAGSP